MTQTLQTAHDAFCLALVAKTETIALPAEITAPQATQSSRFSIYRNNVWSSLTQQLADTFEVVHRLVGESFFKGLAYRFITHHFPTSAVMSSWGEQFAEFIQHDAYCDCIPYLSEIAELEWSRVKVYHAQDEIILRPEQVQNFLIQHQQQLMQCQIRFQAACQVLMNRYNTVEIWYLHQEYKESLNDIRLKEALAQLPINNSSAALIWRNHLQIEVWAIELHFSKFFSELAQGQTISQAISLCLQSYPATEITSYLSFLLQLPCIVSLRCLPYSED